MSTNRSIKFGTLISDGLKRNNGFVNIKDGLIESITSSPDYDSREDYSDHTVIPGLIDIHTHGYKGVDSMSTDSEDIIEWSKQIVSHGVTGIIPTSVSAKHRDVVHFLDRINSIIEESDLSGGAEILGSRMEGPYINRTKAGAHRKEYIRTPSEFEINDISSFHATSLRIIDIAPEISGAKEAIRKLKKQGVLVSAGHTNATFSQASSFSESGVSLFTHFYNAMSGFHHRDVGMVGAGLMLPNFKLELIADMKHVAPEAIDLVIKNKGWRNVILITDSMSATDLGDGTYKLGDLEVEVVEGTCYIKGTRTLAGSTLTLDSALKNLFNHGYDLSEMICSLTKNPAEFIGLKDRGVLEPGYRADLCILDDKMNVAATYIKGERVYHS